MSSYERQLIAILRQSPKIMTILETCRAANLPDWRLASGAIYGTVFNHLTERPYDYGIKDYDICYFDEDLSYEAEDVWIKKIDCALPETLRPLAEVRNQARVHLWFKEKFGSEYSPLSNTDESLGRYLCHAHMVAVRLESDDNISICAPSGLEDIFKMQMRHNNARNAPEKFMEKCLSIKSRWPEIEIFRP